MSKTWHESLISGAFQSSGGDRNWSNGSISECKSVPEFGARTRGTWCVSAYERGYWPGQRCQGFSEELTIEFRCEEWVEMN